jgi:hypothetical protein
MLTKSKRILWSASRLVFTMAILLSLFSVVPTAQAQATVTVSIDSASVDKFGIVHMDVTVTCSEPVVLGEPNANSVEAFVRQPYKRIYTLEGGGHSFITECDGSTQYSLIAFANSGKFSNGIAYIFASAQICDIDNFCVIGEDFLATRLH